jgi:hypothetical protein
MTKRLRGQDNLAIIVQYAKGHIEDYNIKN